MVVNENTPFGARFTYPAVYMTQEEADAAVKAAVERDKTVVFSITEATVGDPIRTVAGKGAIVNTVSTKK